MSVCLSFVQEYYGVRGSLGERLFQLVAKESGGSDGVTFEDLIISKVGTFALLSVSIQSISCSFRSRECE
jgi:hypothetical protein